MVGAEETHIYYHDYEDILLTLRDWSLNEVRTVHFISRYLFSDDIRFGLSKEPFCLRDEEIEKIEMHAEYLCACFESFSNSGSESLQMFDKEGKQLDIIDGFFDRKINRKNNLIVN